MDGDGVKVNIVASGKGVWVDHLGEISAQGSEEVLDINSFFLVCVYMGGGGIFTPKDIACVSTLRKTIWLTPPTPPSCIC